ncbi:MAG: aminoglycoside phosphotransferase family protein [Pseudomonadota bacterium]|nr:aminoglycoside phosphotransferase family protein [Pseudomonadota bacterium]
MNESLIAQAHAGRSAPLCIAIPGQPANVSITLLYQGDLPDSSQIFIVQDPQGVARAVVQLSSPLAPDMVARGIARARDAAAAMGPLLAPSVLLPTSEGDIGGRTYSVMPYCLALSSARLQWHVERIRLRPVIFKWLRGITSTTKRPVGSAELATGYELALKRLLKFDLANPFNAYTRRALDRLTNASWSPMSVLMHGDLWKGNLLLRQTPASLVRPRLSERLAVIDWGAAKMQGYPFFDLVRVSESLRASPKRLRAEALQHGTLLGCDPVDSISYLLAAVGGLLGDHGEFPLDRLAGMASSSLQTLLLALPELQLPQ